MFGNEYFNRQSVQRWFRHICNNNNIICKAIIKSNPNPSSHTELIAHIINLLTNCFCLATTIPSDRTVTQYLCALLLFISFLRLLVRAQEAAQRTFNISMQLAINCTSFRPPHIINLSSCFSYSMSQSNLIVSQMMMMTWRRVNSIQFIASTASKRSEHVSQTDQKESIKTHWLRRDLFRFYNGMSFRSIGFIIHHPSQTIWLWRTNWQRPLLLPLTLAALSEKSIRPESESPFRLYWHSSSSSDQPMFHPMICAKGQC